jgi:hypothetical protein
MEAWFKAWLLQLILCRKGGGHIAQYFAQK